MSSACPLAVEQVDELDHFVNVAGTGLHHASQAVSWLEVAREVDDLFGRRRTPTTEEHVDRAKSLEEFAGSQLAADIPYVHELAIVRMWAILETLWLGFLRENLHRAADSGSRKHMLQVRGSLFEFHLADEKRRAELLVEAMMQKAAKLGLRGTDRFEKAAGWLGVGGSAGALVRRSVVELQSVRNLVVHRSAVADERFAVECPWLRVSHGDRFRISHTLYQRYRFATLWYCVELERRSLSPGSDEAQHYRTMAALEEAVRRFSPMG